MASWLAVLPATFTGAIKTDHNATWRPKVNYALLYLVLYLVHTTYTLPT